MKRVLVSVGFFPPFAQQVVEMFAKLHRQVVRFAILVERDGLADVVDDDLAGIAAREMFLELLANGRVGRAVHVLIQQRQ